MLGLPRGEVFLVPWISEWENEFFLKKSNIQQAIGENIIAIHHIGSTAIKHLSAKPIIDIAIEVNPFKNGEKCIRPLERIGYFYRENVLPDRYYFNKGEPRTHQIHLYKNKNKYLLEQLDFRNYLRNNETERIQYEQLKQSLAMENKQNKHKYADAKTSFVQSILEKIRQ